MFSINKSRIRRDKKDSEQDFVPEKVIYAEIDDEITVVFDRIKNVPAKRIALVIPKGAFLLQSTVNLKILKKKIDELKKEVVMVTTDAAGLSLAEKVGIPATEKLVERSESKKEKAHVFNVDRPTRREKEKVSLSQVLHTDKPHYLLSFIEKMRERLKKRKKKSSETRLVFVAPNKQAFFTLILVGILLLLTIAYIALPGATVYITPRSTILDPAFNVTFLDYSRNRALLDSTNSTGITIGSFPVNPPLFTKKMLHPATGKTFKGEHARGTVTIINTSNTEWELAAKTRFQTDSGLVFRMQSPVRVPPAGASKPGTLGVPVIADDFDAYNQIIGDRGNIPPMKFFLPGLKNEENRKKLYAQSSAPMTGGTTAMTTAITAEDLKAAEEGAKRDVQKNAVNDLKKYLEEQNILNKKNLSLLTNRNVVTIGEPTITIPQDSLGKSVDQFEVTVSYSLKGVAFDKQELVNDLKQRLIAKVDPDKKILKVVEDDITFQFLDEDAAARKIRFTATMRARQIYELDREKENGQRFFKKITDHILGMRISEAQEYLQQQTDEIASIEIKLWPIWAPTIPNIAENIKFVVREEEDI